MKKKIFILAAIITTIISGCVANYTDLPDIYKCQTEKCYKQENSMIQVNELANNPNLRDTVLGPFVTTSFSEVLAHSNCDERCKDAGYTLFATDTYEVYNRFSSQKEYEVYCPCGNIKKDSSGREIKELPTSLVEDLEQQEQFAKNRKECTILCNDGNPCTDDICKETNECAHEDIEPCPNNGVCEMNEYRGELQTCGAEIERTASILVESEDCPSSCDDNDTSTADSYDFELQQCVHQICETMEKTSDQILDIEEKVSKAENALNICYEQARTCSEGVLIIEDKYREVCWKIYYYTGDEERILDLAESFCE